MRALMERGERIGREAAGRKIDEFVDRMMAALPRAEIEKLASGFSIRDLLLIDRWLNDPELRFMGRE